MRWYRFFRGFTILMITLGLSTPSNAQTSDEPSNPQVLVPGGMYDKPFITRLGGRTSLGGYAEFHLRTERVNGVLEEATFQLKRFNLFTYSVINSRIRISSEFEFEEGGEEIKIELGVIDFEIREELNFRAGIILSPLGRFNLSHDGPVNELTDRPLVTTELIPSTLSEPGMGFWGSFYPSAKSRITYELYAVNGFNDGLINGAETRTNQGKPSLAEDNNTVPAVVGRVAFSPLSGLELASSFHVGQYNVSTQGGGSIADREYLKIIATDWEYHRNRFHFVGEYAYASIGLPTGFQGFLADSQQGYYVQTGYRFLTGLSSTFPQSSLTGIVRVGSVDFDTATKGDSHRRVTLGLNFRPIEDTVFKFDYQINTEYDPLNVSTPGRAFLFSVATYF